MTYPRFGSVDTSCETPDETLLSGLLLRLEELSVDDASASVHELLERDRELAERAREHSHVLPELKRRFEALQTVDRVIRRSDTVVPSAWPDIPGYEILGELGRGGMAIVYKAREIALDRFVAIKLLLAGKSASQRLLERFQVEAEVIARLQHPNIVQIHGNGVVDETPYLVLEFISGTNLKEKTAARPMAIREVAELVEIVAAAAEYAHQHDVIHRDLKPSNVLLTNDGVPKLVDFGLAKRSDDSALTLSGETPGTASYMAPEQAKNGRVGPWSDVYSLGAILYEGLTGRPPFLGDSSAETLIQVCNDDPIPPSHLRPKLPRDLEAICQKCLEKNPKRRYASAKMLASDISRWLTGRVTVARPTGAIHRMWKWTRRRPAAAALVILGLLMAFGVLAGWSWHTVRLTAALGLSETLRGRAESSEKLSNDRERRLRDNLYSTHMRLADGASSAGQTNHVLRFLSRYDEGTEDANLRGFEWYYLNDLCHGDVLTMQSHDDIVNGVAFSPDDQYLATGSEDGTARLWKAGTDQLVATLREHTSCVNKLKFSPDGGYLATASCDRTVKLWDTSTLQEQWTFGEHDGPISDVAFSPDGTKLVACVMELNDDSRDSTATVWNVASGARHAVLRGHELGIFSVAFSSDGSTIATGGRDDTIRLWDAHSGKQRNVLREHTADVLTLAFSPDGAVLASGGRDGQIIVWDWRSGEQRQEWRDYPLKSIMFSPDGTTLASSHDDTQIRLWDWTSGEMWHDMIGHTSVVECLAFSNNGRLLATASRDGIVKLWDAPIGNGSIKFFPPLDDMEVHTIAFGPDLKTMASSHLVNGTIRVWDLESGSFRGEVHRTGTESATFMSFSQDGLTLATIGCMTSIEVFRLSDLQQIALRRRGGKSETSVARYATAYANTDRQLLTITDDYSHVTVWDAHELAELNTFQLTSHSSEIRALAVSPDDRLAGAAVWAGFVKLLDLRSGKTLKTLQTAPGCDIIKFSDGSLFAAASNETVTIWDTQTYEEKVRLVCHAGDFTCLAFSPDGGRLATGSSVGRLKLWHVASGQELLNIDRNGWNIGQVRFSRDGSKLAYFCTEDTSVRRSEVHVLSIDRTGLPVGRSSSETIRYPNEEVN